jgi:hypothetical protein
MDRRSFLVGAGATALAGVSVRAQYQPQGRDLAARLVAAQAEDGAILMPGPGPERVCQPYFANLAATGLLLGAPPRSRSDAQSAAKKWMLWYLSHLNKDGTIDDHQGPPGALKPTGKYDSSDGYAGTFLTLAAAYVDQTGDSKTVTDLYPGLIQVARVPLLTLQKSGLTHARPDYPVAYLMDNVEVWKGWDSFSRLAALARKRDDEREYRARADSLLAAIDRWLWAQSEGYYAWALHPDGKREKGLERWYPEVMANLMAIAFLPGDERRRGLFVRLSGLRDLPPGVRALFRENPKIEPVQTVEDLEKMAWWGMAVLARKDQDLLERYQVALARAPWDKLKDLNPALIGHALRVGGARTGAGN